MYILNNAILKICLYMNNSVRNIKLQATLHNKMLKFNNTKLTFTAK